MVVYKKKILGTSPFYLIIMTTMMIIIFLLLIHIFNLQKATTPIVKMPDNLGNNMNITNDVRLDGGRCGGNTMDPLSNPYSPPIKCDNGGLIKNPLVFTVPLSSTRLNIPTQHYDIQFSQMGIITRSTQNNKENDILPLFGRRTITTRNKWQYYTITGGGGGGHLHTKLPIKVKGRSCSGEYGCDEIYNGDEVYVEGFQSIFIVTMYENGMFSYIP